MSDKPIGEKSYAAGDGEAYVWDEKLEKWVKVPTKQ